MTAAVIRPVSPFAVATLAPLPLLTLAAAFGGAWALAALLYMTALRFVLDGLIATAGPGAAPGTEWPAAERLSQALGIAHFPVLALGVAAVAGVTGLGFWEGVAAFLAFGMYLGQVSTSNAHELIHRTDRFQFSLGKWVLISLLYGHHVTAHLKVHHRFVATPDDPNTAYLGQGFYEFLGQAWAGAFLAGWEIEQSAARIKGEAMPWWKHPYAAYGLGGAAFVLAFLLAFGPSGLIAFLLLAAYAQLQLILSDYVQHYGLRRRRVGDGWEPVAPWHSWNAAHWFSGGLMLNATRHSEHHTNPAVPFPELGLPDHMEGPRLPRSLPTMAAVALVPPLWRRMMDRRAAAWQARIDDAAIRRSPRLAPLPAGGAGAAVAPAAADPVAAAPVSAPQPPPQAPPQAPVTAAPAADPAAPAPVTARPARRIRLGAEPARVASSALWTNGGARGDATAAADDREAPPAAPSASGGLSDAPSLSLAGPDPADGAGGGADEPGGEPTQARFVRSSALFQSDAADDDAGPSPAPGAEGGTGRVAGPRVAADPMPNGDMPNGDAAPVAPAPPSDPAAEPGAGVEAAIADLVQSSRTETRRRRARFPSIEAHSDDEDEDDPREQALALARAGQLAARALAALLRGAPPGGGPARD